MTEMWILIHTKVVMPTATEASHVGLATFPAWVKA